MRLIGGLCTGQKKKKNVLCQSDVLKNISQNLDLKICLLSTFRALESEMENSVYFTFSKLTLSILSHHSFYFYIQFIKII